MDWETSPLSHNLMELWGKIHEHNKNPQAIVLLEPLDSLQGKKAANLSSKKTESEGSESPTDSEAVQSWLFGFWLRRGGQD